MPDVPFDVVAFGKLSDALDGTEHVGPQKKAELGFTCMRQFDGLGKDLDTFVRNLTDANLIAALEDAILKAKNARFKFRKPVRLYELIREVRNRCSRVQCGTYTEEDRRELVRFGNAIRTFKATAAAA